MILAMVLPPFRQEPGLELGLGDPGLLGADVLHVQPEDPGNFAR
jgi:hypothetical protein